MGVQDPVGRFKSLLASLNCDGRRWAVLLVLCLLLFAPELAGDQAREAWRYERTAIADGAWWRLLSAHFVHLDTRHAVLNILGLILMWALFARAYSVWQWMLIVVAAIAAIDVGLWVLEPDVSWYVGLSGVLHGVMAAGTIGQLRRREPYGWILLAFLVGKLAYEQWTGALPLAGEDVPVVVDAHLYGALGSVALALFLRPRPL